MFTGKKIHCIEIRNNGKTGRKSETTTREIPFPLKPNSLRLHLFHRKPEKRKQNYHGFISWVHTSFFIIWKTRKFMSNFNYVLQ